MRPDCAEFDLLSAYVDNETTAMEAKTLELHLAGCRECREELEILRDTKDMTAAPARRAPADLTALLVAQAQAARAEALEAQRTRFPGWAAGLAAAASRVVWVGVRGAAQPSIPLSALIAAHERPAGAALTVHDQVRSASVYSGLVRPASSDARS